MSEIVTVTVTGQGQTVDAIVSRLLGRYVPGVVEATFDANRDLAGAIHIPVGTRVRIPMPTAAEVEQSTAVIFLTD